MFAAGGSGFARAAVGWITFAACVAVLAGTVWGGVRTTGPLALAGLTAAGWVMGLIDRPAAARRLAVLLVTAAAAHLLRNHAPDLLAHRGARLVLVYGLAVVAVLSVPPYLIGLLGRVAAAVAARPNGPAVWAVAVCGVAVPVFALQVQTSPLVWAGDTLPVVPTVVQLAGHGTRDLSPFVARKDQLKHWAVCGTHRPYFVRPAADGGAGLYSAYPAGMELFAGPAVLAGWAAGVDLEDGETQLLLERLSAAAVSGACLTLFFLIALHVGSPGAAFAATWLLATGSVFSTTVGMLLWQQGGVILWSLLAVWVEVRSNGRPGWGGVIVQGLACGSMLACRPSAVTFLVPFGVWVLARDWRRGIVLPLLSAVAFLPWGVMYHDLYRTPFGPSMGFLAERWFPGEYVAGVLVSPGRGLLVYQPWIILLGLLAVPAVRSGGRPLLPGLVPFALGAVGLHILLVGSWPVWWGGACYGSRLAAEVVPAAGLFAVRPVGWLLRFRWGWVVVAAVGSTGVAAHAPCAYYDAWLWNALPVSCDAHPERLRDWADPPFLYATPPPK